MSDVTRILSAIEQGDPLASEQLLPLVVDVATKATPDQLVAIDDALAKLAREDPSAAKLVELRYFAGLTVDEAGQSLGMSTATAYKHWNYARAWLHGELLGTAES